MKEEFRTNKKPNSDPLQIQKSTNILKKKIPPQFCGALLCFLLGLWSWNNLTPGRQEELHRRPSGSQHGSYWLGRLPRAPNIGSSGPGNNDDVKQAKRGGGRVNKEQGINKNIEKHMEK